MAFQKIYLVIPTIRDLTFFTAWKDAFRDCHLLIIEDRETKTVKLPHTHFSSVTHYCWEDIRRDFGNDEWIFSRHNAGIRSYGFWKAYQAGSDIIITLDDDCYPVGDPTQFVQNHIDNLSFKAPEKWFATYPDPRWMYTRGFPYDTRGKYPVKVSHGLWSGALDLDGKTESQLPELLTEKPYPPIRQVIPFGYYYSMCSMNLAFYRDVTPLMFFPMMGEDEKGNKWGYDRYDDIWAGIFSKKIMDHLGWSVVNGSPQVEHKKASIAKSNLQKEKLGLVENEFIWRKVDSVQLSCNTPTEIYRELADNINFSRSGYFDKLKLAMNIWVELFQ